MMQAPRSRRLLQLPLWLEVLVGGVILGTITTVIYRLLALYGSAQAMPAPWWMDTPLDPLVPFVPTAVWMYVTWYPAIPVLMCTDRETVRRGFIAVALAFTACSLGHTLWPVTIDRPVLAADTGISARFLDWFYAFDPPRNLFPSFHAAGATLVATLRPGRAAMSRGVVLWAIALCVSCVLIKQHFIIDVVVGAVVGIAAAACARRALAGRRAPPARSVQPTSPVAPTVAIRWRDASLAPRSAATPMPSDPQASPTVPGTALRADVAPAPLFRVLCAAVATALLAVPAPVRGFVDVAHSGDLVSAARWSPSDVDGHGLGDGHIEVLIEPGFAAAIATAVTGAAAPQDIADIETAVRAAFAAWQSPVLQFELVFGGAAVRGSENGGEIDVFAVLSSDPVFDVDAVFGVTYLTWTFLSDRRLTNGSVLAGNAITGADIYLATDRLAAAAPSLTREQQLRALQRLMMHELGHALGFAHPHDAPALNYDTDADPFDAMLIDPADPLAALVRSANVDTSAVMARLPTNGNALFNTALRNDDRGGRDAFYPAPGTIPAICQRMPQPGCRAAVGSSLDVSAAGGGAVLWRWLRGTATVASDFAEPAVATRYSLCVYTGALPAIAGELALPAGRRWRARPGKPLRYADATGAPQGVRQALLQAGAQDQARIAVKAGGDMLPAGLLPLEALPVVVQLVRADSPVCWGSTFEPAAINSTATARSRREH